MQVIYYPNLNLYTHSFLYQNDQPFIVVILFCLWNIFTLTLTPSPFPTSPTTTELPFQPTIPISSKILVAASASSTMDEDTVTRLLKPVERNKTAATTAAHADLTFQPKIPTPPPKVIKGDTMDGGVIKPLTHDNGKPVHDRLYLEGSNSFNP